MCKNNRKVCCTSEPSTSVGLTVWAFKAFSLFITFYLHVSRWFNHAVEGAREDTKTLFSRDLDSRRNVCGEKLIESQICRQSKAPLKMWSFFFLYFFSININWFTRLLSVQNSCVTKDPKAYIWGRFGESPSNALTIYLKNGPAPWFYWTVLRERCEG